MRPGYLILLWALFSPTVLGLEVIHSDAKHSVLVQELIHKIEPVLIELESKEQQRLAPVKIKVVPNLMASDIALSLGGKIPRVLISDQFIQGLNAYAEAYVVALHSQSPDFPEQYFHHYFWDNHPDFSGTEVDTPVHFSKTDPRYKRILTERKNELLQSALMDIILHELGHHAKRAFYNYKASFFLKQEMEQLADDWALGIRDSHFPELDPIGRLLSIAFIFERDRWSMLSGDTNYPRMITWIADNADSVCEDAIADHVRNFCSQLEKNIDVYFSARAESAYRDRVDQGDGYATFPLAQILLKKNRYYTACKYFKESQDRGNIKRAAVYVAWCYMNGFLQPSPPDAQILALTNYRDAMVYGYTDTQQYIESLNQNYLIQ